MYVLVAQGAWQGGAGGLDWRGGDRGLGLGAGARRFAASAGVTFANRHHMSNEHVHEQIAPVGECDSGVQCMVSWAPFHQWMAPNR